MCGIFGWIKHREPLTPAEITAAQRATRTLAHRGPDHHGSWHDRSVFMGHRRLSILDHGAQSNQPFHDREERFVLSFNGEIYNYRELAATLRRRGHDFETQSDTEVLLTALTDRGMGALQDLDGMFAGALHDRHSGRHWLFRDPLGQKPLYYYACPDGVVYASELRALLSLDAFTWHLDRDRLLRFLSAGYYAGDATPLRGVNKLLPGCVLEIDRGVATLQRWWNSRPGDERLDLDEATARGQVRDLVRDSCRMSLRARGAATRHVVELHARRTPCEPRGVSPRVECHGVIMTVSAHLIAPRPHPPRY
ncbi:MAG: hypothetical protein CMJ18_15870 [Phycisphaeraceae bacterium]|nr:hypothetical protein [Phycisphaeraceae bacterium]